jgi:hypothetical protein
MKKVEKISHPFVQMKQVKGVFTFQVILLNEQVIDYVFFILQPKSHLVKYLRTNFDEIRKWRFS